MIFLARQLVILANISSKMTPIIVINWNGIKDTLECIQSIRTHTHCKYKIYLIDNASDNNEGFKLSAKYGGMTDINVICYKQNYGFAGAHNKIWSEIRLDNSGAYISLINNDTIVTSGWLTKLLEKAIETKSSLSGPLLLDFYNRGQIDSAGHELLASGEIIPRGNGIGLNIISETKELAGISGGACLISKELIRKRGFFDEFFSTGYEDAEFGFRAAVCREKISIVSNSRVYHKGGNSIKRIYTANYAIKTQRNILYTVVKLYPLPCLCLMLPYILFRYLILLFVSLVFLKWRYFKIIYTTLYHFISHDIWLAIQSRKQMLGIPKIGLIRFFTLQRSSVLFDFKRLYTYFILNENSSLDQYR